MRKMLLAAAVFAVATLLVASAFAFTREAVLYNATDQHDPDCDDCWLQTYNTCSGWVWVFEDVQGAVWGTVMNPNDCEYGCPNGGAVEEIWFWGYCSPAAPAMINSVGISLVNAIHCPTTTLWASGPVTVFNCVPGMRWTSVPVPLVHVGGQDFAVTVEWGPGDPIMQFATDNGVGNLFCWLGYVGVFPGCAATTLTCAGWGNNIPPQVTYIYVTDFNGDTTLDDLCYLYGYPYPMAFPYAQYYGYLPNNLMVVACLDCTSPTAVENTSWGHVKALYE